MAEQYLVTPKPPPALNIPKSDNVVKVSVIDPVCRIEIPMGRMLQPEYSGKPNLKGPCLSFLIEHPSRKPILFDLGVRKDWQVLPSYLMWKDLGWYIFVENDVATMLKDQGIDVDGGAVESIIWSHHHWDHVGDASTFPHSTELVVGPGFKDAHLPGYPTRKEATLMDTDFEGRELREINFEKESAGLKIGRFNALDYFGDGSFYLLDTPGHTIGHICGLARTTADTFVFMGGDASHHGGEFRPNQHLPIPRELKPSPMKRRTGACPGELLREVHRAGNADAPFYLVTKNFAHDKAVADWTIDGLGEFDAHENVLLLTAHDDVVVDPAQFDFYPAAINDWQKKDVAKRIKWMFLGDFEGATEAKERGKEAFKWGDFNV